MPAKRTLSVMRALELAGFTLVDEPAQAQVILLNGSIPNPAGLAGQVKEGRGLVLILGSQTSAEDTGTLLGFPVELERREAPVSLTGIDFHDPLTSEILWNSAPQVRERFDVLTPVSAVQPAGTGYEDGVVAAVAAAERSGAFVVNALLNGAPTRSSRSGLTSTT